MSSTTYVPVISFLLCIIYLHWLFCGMLLFDISLMHLQPIEEGSCSFGIRYIEEISEIGCRVILLTTFYCVLEALEL
jgi:hypothetical protein